MFAEKQKTLLMERVKTQERINETRQRLDRNLELVERTVELAKSPSMLYKTASPEKKRELVKTLLSNLTVSRKNVDIALALPFQLIAKREKTSDGRPYRGTCRTWEEILEELYHQLNNTRPVGGLKMG